MKGRFAPSPTGRMHLGNVFAALMSWLSVRRAGGQWVLRIEDLDPQRSKEEYARLIEDDLRWLGLEWDEGGYDASGGRYRQSRRHDFYEAALEKICSTGYVYPCFCTRSDIMATQAPHQSDGRIVYAGTCRPPHLPAPYPSDAPAAAMRLFVPDEEIEFTDAIAGHQSFNLARQCGDFILRRADGAWAYQLAVVVDDADMGITEVVRGNDLLLSAAQQIHIYHLLGLTPPAFAHLPLLCNSEGRRLSKRDKSLSMEALREQFTAEQVIGNLAYAAGIAPTAQTISAAELIDVFTLPPAVETLRLCR